MALVSDIEIRLRADIARLQQDMDAARRTVGGAMDNIRSTVNGAAKAFGLLAAGMAAGAFAGWIKSAIDATDVISDLSQKTGVAIKDIGGLQLWFQKGGTEAGVFESTMVKLSKQIASGGEAFARLGIRTQDANGIMRTNVDVLLDTADAFAQMQDGTAKTAMAVELFGKSGAELIPLLNEGSEGLREMQEMAEKLGLTFNEETVEAAGNFNDTLDFMGGALQGVSRQVAAQMLPTLNSLSGALLRFITEGNGVRQAADVIGTGFKLIYTVGSTVVQAFSAVGKTLGMLAAQIVAIFQLDFKQAMNIGHAWQADMKESFSSTAKSISDVWTGTGGDIVAALATSQSAGTVATDKVVKDVKRQVEAVDELLKFNERADKYAEDRAKLQQAQADASQKVVDKANEEAASIEAQVAAFGMSKSAIEAVTLARLEDQYARSLENKLNYEEIQQLEQLIEAKKRSVAATGQLEGLEEAKRAGEEFDKILDSTKAQDFGDTLAKAFGRAGSAMGQLSTTFQAYAKKQTDFAKARDALEKKHSVGQRNEKEYLADLSKLEKARFSEQLGGYGDMAGAAAGFFNEQSKGYKVVTAISQAFHAAELAATMAELVPKAISAVLTQGQGDPITAFPRMAAMLAFVAALGVSLGGGGGATMSVSQQRQKANGTGSVLGDSDAKSESLKKALEMVEDNTYRNLAVNYDMLAALRNIESSLSGLGNLIVRTTGISGKLGEDIASGAEKSFNKIFGTGSLGEKLTGGLTGKIIGSIFGGKVTSLDTGLTANAASIAAIMGGGLSASQYNDTKKSGGWFSSDKYRTQTTQLGDQINDQFTKVILSMVEGVKSAGSVLGIAGDDFTNRLNSFVVDIGKISLTGLKGDEIQEALEAAFSKVGDDLASFAVSGLSEFQKVGEGTYETLVRIANNYATVDAVLDSFGKSFGAVGLASVAARESLIDLSGGLEEFTSQGSFFLENFFSDAEKEATLRTAVYARLDKISGGSTVQTVEQFKALVLAQDLTTQAGREAYASLMSVSQAFIDMTKFGDAAAEKAKEIASQRGDLEIQIMELSGDAVGALAAQRELEKASVDASLRPLYDRIYALQDEATATEKAKTIAQARQTLEIQLMELSGDAVGALAAKRQIEMASTDESLRPLLARIYALQDLNTLEEKASKLLSARQNIQMQILEAEGNSVEALAMKRQIELAATDESLRPLLARIYALQDLNTLEDKASKLLAARQNIQMQILEAEGNSVQALAMKRQIELAAVDESLRPLYLRLYALQDEKKATDDATAAQDKLKAARDKNIQTALGLLQRSVNAEKEIVTTAYQDAMKDLEGYIDDVNGSIENTKALSQSLKSALGGLSVNSDAARAASQQVGQQQIAMALKVAKATGVLPSANELAAALSAVTSVSMDDYGSYLDYIKATARTASDIGELNGITETQLTIEERQLALLMDEKDAATIRYNAEIERLDKMVTAAQMQVDGINGVDTRVMEVSAALAQFTAAITGSAIPVVAPGVTGSVPWQQTSATAQQSDTMGGSSVITELQRMNTRLENIERYTGSLDGNIDQVTAGGNAMRTVEA